MRARAGSLLPAIGELPPPKDDVRDQGHVFFDEEPHQVTGIFGGIHELHRFSFLVGGKDMEVIPSFLYPPIRMSKRHIPFSEVHFCTAIRIVTIALYVNLHLFSKRTRCLEDSTIEIRSQGFCQLINESNITPRIAKAIPKN